MCSKQHTVGALGLALILTVGTVEAASLEFYESAIDSQSAVIHFWPLNDLDVDDSLGTYTGTAAGVSADADVLGRPGKALYFSGSGSEVVNSPNLTLGNSGTLEAFIRVDDKSAGNGYLISARTGSSGTDRFYLFKDSSGNIEARLGNGSYVTILPSSEYSDGEWRYVAFKWEPSGSNYNVRTYYSDTDGLVKYRANSTGSGTPPSDTPFAFGRYAVSAQEYIDGAMDNIVLYNESLDTTALHNHFRMATYSAPQHLLNYQETVAATSGLIHYWPVDNRAAEDVVGTIDHGETFYSGTTTPSVTMTAGPWGHTDSAMEFNGVDSHWAYPDSSLTLGDTGTLELWVRPDSAPDDRGYAFSARKIDGGTQDDRLYIMSWDQGSGDELRFGFGHEWDAGKICDIEGHLGEWFYVTLTWEPNSGDPSLTDVYTYYAGLDGVLHAGDAYLGNTGFAPQAARLVLGRYSAGSQYFQGALDEIAIYNRVLSLDEMALHVDAMEVPEPSTLAMLLGLAGFGLLAWYRRR